MFRFVFSLLLFILVTVVILLIHRSSLIDAEKIKSLLMIVVLLGLILIVNDLKYHQVVTFSVLNNQTEKNWNSYNLNIVFIILIVIRISNHTASQLMITTRMRLVSSLEGNNLMPLVKHSFTSFRGRPKVVQYIIREYLLIRYYDSLCLICVQYGIIILANIISQHEFRGLK